MSKFQIYSVPLLFCENNIENNIELLFLLYAKILELFQKSNNCKKLYTSTIFRYFIQPSSIALQETQIHKLLSKKNLDINQYTYAIFIKIQNKIIQIFLEMKISVNLIQCAVLLPQVHIIHRIFHRPYTICVNVSGILFTVIYYS